MTNPHLKRRCVIDAAIGETRAAVWEGKTLVELYVRRWTDAGQPRRGDRFSGRVRRIEKSLGAAFIDLGTEPHGFLKFTTAPNAPRFTEGQRVEVEITREAEAGKGPVVAYICKAESDKVGRLSGDDLKAFIGKRFEGITFEEASVGTLTDAVETELSIPMGGTITIERTRALTAIDIDSGIATSPFEVAKAACPLIARQLRLRGIGGLVAIDFPNLRQRKQREQIVETLTNAFADDPNMVKIAPLSRFGVIEMTRSRLGPSLDETIADKFGDLTIETQALESLRQLEREGRVSPGAQLEMSVPEPVFAWLESGFIEWKAPLTDRIGARFSVKPGAKFSITADR